MKKVMVFGTFNIIHPGHLNLFRQAREFGDRLFVVLARDKTVQDIKNYNPLDEIKRRENLVKIPLVDTVILGDFDDRMQPIKQVQPDVICLGYDQYFFIDKLEAYLAENNLDIPVMRMKPYNPEKYKSSKLID